MRILDLILVAAMVVSPAATRAQPATAVRSGSAAAIRDTAKRLAQALLDGMDEDTAGCSKVLARFGKVEKVTHSSEFRELTVDDEASGISWSMTLHPDQSVAEGRSVHWRDSNIGITWKLPSADMKAAADAIALEISRQAKVSAQVDEAGRRDWDLTQWSIDEEQDGGQITIHAFGRWYGD